MHRKKAAFQEKKKALKKGLPPGSIVFTGESTASKANLHCIVYNEKSASFERIDRFPLQSIRKPAEGEIVWYDLKGVDQVEVIKELGKAFGIHPLALEDIANVRQRPKFEEFENGNFLVARAFRFHQQTLSFQSEQISIYFGRDFLMTFQEDEAEMFETVFHQLQGTQSKLRTKKPDYLAYTLVDFIVDEYIEHLSIFEDHIVNLENDITENPVPTQKKLIYHLKRELMIFRKSVHSLREAIGRMSKSEMRFVDPENSFYLRDLLDHLTQVLEQTENYREMLTDLQNLYVAEIGYKANSVMKTLTVVSTIFIPLTFIVGIYGMNFDYMPELRWTYGYFLVIGAMLVIAILSLYYFRRKRWI